MTRILPIRYRAALPVERLIRHESPSAEAIEMDVLFVGAGPAGLAGAIELGHELEPGSNEVHRVDRHRE